jgi:hypothetical protein
MGTTVKRASLIHTSGKNTFIIYSGMNEDLLLKI